MRQFKTNNQLWHQVKFTLFPYLQLPHFIQVLHNSVLCFSLEEMIFETLVILGGIAGLLNSSTLDRLVFRPLATNRQESKEDPVPLLDTGKGAWVLRSAKRVSVRLTSVPWPNLVEQREANNEEDFSLARTSRPESSSSSPAFLILEMLGWLKTSFNSIPLVA